MRDDFICDNFSISIETITAFQRMLRTYILIFRLKLTSMSKHFHTHSYKLQISHNAGLELIYPKFVEHFYYKLLLV